MWSGVVKGVPTTEVLLVLAVAILLSCANNVDRKVFSFQLSLYDSLY